MSAFSLELSLGLDLSPAPYFGSTYHEKPMGARSGYFGIYIYTSCITETSKKLTNNNNNNNNRNV